MRAKLLVICLFSLMFGCEQSEPIQPFSSSFEQQAKWLNPQINKRFARLTNEPSETRLTAASPLELVNGELRDMINCTEIEKMPIEQVIEREQSLLVAAKTDCKIARRYIEAVAANTSKLPASLDQSELLSLPADLIPAMNLETPSGRLNGSLRELDIKIIEPDQEWVHTITSNDALIIKLTEVARADFNQDGAEDLMLMSEWQIKDSWDGQGIELFIIEYTGQEPQVSWRFKAIRD